MTPPIKGYRSLSPAEVSLMNEGKELGIKIGEYVDRLMELPNTDKRWVAIGKTDMQKGLMCLLRGIAQPETF